MACCSGLFVQVVVMVLGLDDRPFSSPSNASIDDI